jgi:hypothetical protein
MVHKMQLKDVEVKAIIILAQPTEDIKQALPNGVPVKEVKETDIMTDYDETQDEFINSLAGSNKINDELIPKRP